VTGTIKLSSAHSPEIFSAIAPITTAINAIINSVEFPIILGVNITTMLEKTTNANEPSKLLKRNLVFPNFLHIKAAAISPIIRIENPVITKILGNRNMTTVADINT